MHELVKAAIEAEKSGDRQRAHRQQELGLQDLRLALEEATAAHDLER